MVLFLSDNKKSPTEVGLLSIALQLNQLSELEVRHVDFSVVVSTVTKRCYCLGERCLTIASHHRHNRLESNWVDNHTA